jgi:hypothetical protein
MKDVTWLNLIYSLVAYYSFKAPALYCTSFVGARPVIFTYGTDPSFGMRQLYKQVPPILCVTSWKRTRRIEWWKTFSVNVFLHLGMKYP